MYFSKIEIRLYSGHIKPFSTLEFLVQSSNIPFRRTILAVVAGAVATALLTISSASAHQDQRTVQSEMSAAHRDSQVDSEARNKKLVLAFYDLSFNKKNPQKAADRYIGAHYTQHNPQYGDGKSAFVAGAKAYIESVPTLKVDVKRAAADGNLVWLHSKLTTSPTDRGTAFADIFRVEKGKIVEHWDVIQSVPETAANNNGMF